ncbi:MAG: hypothetical protein SFX72_14035 [Isosphaeraceae bacterium]|nr:hypothetical protein [Isosphaeraceae bacterium]
MVEYAFRRYRQDGLAPARVTIEGWNFDILAGSIAQPTAVGLAVGWLGRRAVIAWNLDGPARLGTAAWSVVTSAPSPFRLDRPGDPFTVITTRPQVWGPALVAPAAVFFRVVSLQRCLPPAKFGDRSHYPDKVKKP